IPLATVGILTLTPDRSGSMAVMGHRSARDTVRDIVRLMRRRVIARIMTIDFLLSAAAGVTGALFLFFFRSVKGFSVNEANLMLFAYFIGSLLGAPIWVRVSRRMGKHNALLLAASCYAVAQASQIFLPRGNAFVYIPWMLIAGLPYAAITFLLRAMMADAIDLVKLETGRDESGLLFGFLGSTNKLAYGMAVGIMYPLLQFIGFDASEAASNGSAVLTSVSALYIVPTALLVLGGVAALTNYPLPARLHDEISRKLAERTAAAA
ncbi:MAG TPA: MFS transporter, partial [Sphingomicrobium sp.]